FSIWNWHTLPDYIDQRYIDYARANASIGINGTVLTNVNSNALILTEPYLQKEKALAELFRPNGIKVYLTARFSAPIEIGGLETADPLNQKVVAWWKDKANEIYSEIPDFGGFLVKANSEGQPGPQNYGRNHVDGANMLARAVKPHKGVVMWRAFVYSEHNDEDRAKQAYSEFVPYDGKFDDNVIIQVKNGAIDFQPREPFHPMFGAMPNTPLMMEFQITQEYLGQGTHLVYLPALFEEVLEEDTYVKGKGSTVAKVIDGELFNYEMTGMAGVSNIGTDRNWTGHHFLQANWYGYGRLAWNHELKAEDIAREWIALTLTRNSKAIDSITEIMMESREAVVNYMDPLGLHHIFATSHHYGPGPWVDNLGRPDWNPVYYHQADSEGVGFDRTKTGSNALEQYSPAIQKEYGNIKTIPEKYLLWFHHVPWDYNLNNGKTLWDNLALKYQKGVNQVIDMKNSWSGLRKDIDPTIHKEVSMMLDIQLAEARWWKDACLSYFNSFAKKKYPLGVEPPKHSLEYYKTLKFPYAPGIRPQW
ncbi:alpha-glucuronidase, partial [Aegicerativicinus sediminis]